jgi:hypothetical protein
MRVRNHITSGPQSIKIIVAPYNQEFFYRYNFTTTVQTLLEQILTVRNIAFFFWSSSRETLHNVVQETY